MKKIPEGIVHFLKKQGFVIVCTLDEDGYPHASCKGIVKIDSKGKVYLFDLYRNKTFKNLKRNYHVSINAVDEHRFKGYCLKGKAKIMKEKLTPSLIKSWESRLTTRLTQRLIKNIHGEKGHKLHPEAFLPKPEYLIILEVKEIVDLTPSHIKGA